MLNIKDFTVQIRESMKVGLKFALEDTSDEQTLVLLKNVLTLLQINSNQIKNHDKEEGDDLHDLKQCLNDPISTLFAARNPRQYSSEDREAAKLLCKIALLGAVVDAVNEKSSVFTSNLQEDINALRNDLAEQWNTMGKNYLAYLEKNHRQIQNNQHVQNIQIVVYEGVQIGMAFMLTLLLYLNYAELMSHIKKDGANVVTGVSNYVTGETGVDLEGLAQDSRKFIVDLLTLVATVNGAYKFSNLVSSTGTFAVALNQMIREQREAIAKVQEDIGQFTLEVNRSLTLLKPKSTSLQ